ncbi:AprI/Inh family metalloprotease inhibitor [Bosea sp. 2RAB26]|uniref:AprI/Inh family metalloprotease inhibitor n=1 Tax=Bosea sp. 2RAB26 TaxID=3237476 RepID=UPI003F93A6D4
MTTVTATRHRFFKAACLLPFLALTACAGSQRFNGPGPGFSGGPGYGQPQLQSAPPISSAPVTSQPLPPPGGYPAASAPSSPGALPPPQDPFFDPNAGRPQPQSAPPVAGATEIPQLRGGSGQVATLGQSAAPARSTGSSRDSVIGSWTAREATGSSCRIQLSSTPALDLYRANAAGCANRDLQKVNAWDYRDGEVYLYQPGGTVVARLRAGDSGSMNGAVTKSGAALSLNR